MTERPGEAYLQIERPEQQGPIFDMAQNINNRVARRSREECQNRGAASGIQKECCESGEQGEIQRRMKKIVAEYPHRIKKIGAVNRDRPLP